MSCRTGIISKRWWLERILQAIQIIFLMIIIPTIHVGSYIKPHETGRWEQYGILYWAGEKERAFRYFGASEMTLRTWFACTVAGSYQCKIAINNGGYNCELRKSSTSPLPLIIYARLGSFNICFRGKFIKQLRVWFLFLTFFPFWNENAVDSTSTPSHLSKSLIKKHSH